ncbi:MAG: glycosyltransferase [Bacteroidales bacterium]|nr:glycosyltransferase [Bacteroidales bacterium]
MKTYSILFFIGKYPNFGGTERITTLLANHFCQQGCSVTILACESKCDMSLMGLDKRVNVYWLPNSSPKPNASNVRYVRHILQKHQINIIFNQWCLPFFVTVMLNWARRGMNVRLISVLHGIPNCSKKLLIAQDKMRMATNPLEKAVRNLAKNITDWSIRKSIKWVYYHSDYYVLLSPRFIPLMQDYASLSDVHKVLAIGNPITIQTSYSSLEFLKKKEKQILYVGRLDKENKRVDRVLQVWQTLQSKHPDWKLVLVGDGPHRTELENYVHENRLERVLFTGFIKEDPIAYYKQSAILLLTSDLEGFGLVIVEAMSYGVVPVVYGSYESVYDIITDGRDGFITHTPFDCEEMSERVATLMNDTALRQSMSEQAVESSKRFELSNILNQWNELITKVCE